MSDLKTLKQSDNLPKIVNTIAIATVLLACIYASYSYLVTQLKMVNDPLIHQLDVLRIQLKKEKKKRQLAEQENEKLTILLEKRNSEIKRFITQFEEEQISQPLIQQCSIDEEKTNDTLLRKAIHMTLSRKAEERFRGFSILMNNIDYMSEQMQRETIEFYLKRIDKKNKVGVYYAAFIMSELRPHILKEYQPEIERAYHAIYQQPGWERTSYKYCQIENKMGESYQ